MKKPGVCGKLKENAGKMIERKLMGLKKKLAYKAIRTVMRQSKPASAGNLGVSGGTGAFPWGSSGARGAMGQRGDCGAARDCGGQQLAFARPGVGKCYNS